MKRLLIHKLIVNIEEISAEYKVIMITYDIQLNILRMAYRSAKTDSERSQIRAKAEALRAPPAPEVDIELAQNISETITSLPDWTHPYWQSNKS